MTENQENSGNEEIEKPEDFPIPRLMRIDHPKKALVPNYNPPTQKETFNADLFQLYFSLVNFHLKNYDLNTNQEFSPALEMFCTAFDDDLGSTQSKKMDPALLKTPENLEIINQMVRKFLIECQNKFFQLTNEQSLTKIAVLHNELYFASEVMRQNKTNRNLMDFCDVLMANTYDLYNAVISQMINEKYWAQNKSAEDLINDLLKKEMVTIRTLNNQSLAQLSQCIIRRALDKAPTTQAAQIRTWATKNEISFEDSK